MTTAPPSRPLGRGVSQLIPQSPTAAPADRATAALAALRTVSVHVGVLEAAVALLEHGERQADDEGIRAVVRETVELLRAAMDQGGAPVPPGPTA